MRKEGKTQKFVSLWIAMYFYVIHLGATRMQISAVNTYLRFPKAASGIKYRKISLYITQPLPQASIIMQSASDPIFLSR